jgi:hypothetical protein
MASPVNNFLFHRCPQFQHSSAPAAHLRTSGRSLPIQSPISVTKKQFADHFICLFFAPISGLFISHSSLEFARVSLDINMDDFRAWSLKTI